MRLGFQYASQLLEQQKDLLNRLNVFPVADQDTGVNMARSLTETARVLSEGRTPAAVCQEAWQLLLEYGHGNSGTILTLFFEGFSLALPDGPRLSGGDLARAFSRGAQTAFEAVDKPMDGTILSVAGQSARAGLSLLEITDAAGVVFQRITQEAHAALLLTPLQNPILQKHRVVDSGAYGFCLILDGFLKSFAPEMAVPAYPPLRLPELGESPSSEPFYRYCTEFVLSLPGERAEALERELRPMGDCFLCVSRGDRLKVHLHTNRPDEVLALAAACGEICSQKIDDMRPDK